jgi:hypothetical protein
LNDATWDSLDYSAASFIEEEIARRFNQVENRMNVRRFLDASTNAMTAVIGPLAQVYSEPPQRKFRLQKDTKLLQDITDLGLLDIQMEECNRLALA